MILDDTNNQGWIGRHGKGGALDLVSHVLDGFRTGPGIDRKTSSSWGWASSLGGVTTDCGATRWSDEVKVRAAGQRLDPTRRLSSGLRRM